MEPSTTAPEGIIMKANEGGIDRGVRIAVGLVLVALAATGTVGLWGWIGVVPLATGLIGWCPAYTLLGFNTCPANAKG
jgi:hypothetical protein